ncbi:MAG: hypothetical protein ACJAYP_000841 [Flavobacterium sp.]|jgi:hypothetical protein
MKKIIFLLLISFSLTSFNTNDIKTQLIGEWIGEDKGEIGKMVFQKNGFAYFEFQNKIFGGESFEMNGKKGSMKYVIDDRKNPFNVDLIISIEGTQIRQTQYCIGRFINKSKLQFAMGFEGERPKDFDNENSIIFNKNN